MDSKLQPVQLYGFSKSRLYEPPSFSETAFVLFLGFFFFFLSIFMGTV